MIHCALQVTRVLKLCEPPPFRCLFAVSTPRKVTELRYACTHSARHDIVGCYALTACLVPVTRAALPAAAAGESCQTADPAIAQR